MRRIHPSRFVALAVAAMALLTACGTGQAPLTSRVKTAIQGLNLQQGTVKILDAALVLDPQGSASATPGTAHLRVLLFNTGSIPDTLQSVSSTAAGTVAITVGAKSVSTVTLPSLTAVSFFADNTIDLHGITPAPQIGTYVPVTFTFALAGVLSTALPVLTSDSI